MRVHRIARAVALFLLLAGAKQAPAEFIPLGHLPGGVYSASGGVSADGSVVVGISSSAAAGSGDFEAFRWTAAGGMVGLGFLPGGLPNSLALDVSADGAVVVGEGRSARGFEAFRWTGAEGMTSLNRPGAPVFPGIAHGVSGDGSLIVGQGFSASGNEGFRWTAASGPVGLGDLPGGTFESQAIGVSLDGSVIVGGGTSASGREAFRWTQADGMIGLGDLPGGDFESFAYAVSADGSVVVGYGTWGSAASGRERIAFRWTQADGMIGLGDLPGGDFFSIAFDVSADGSVVVGAGHSERGTEAFIWDDTNGIRNLRDVLIGQGDDLTGWRLTTAQGISADGTTIVGTGINPSGQTEAWVARLGPTEVIPEPGTLTLLGLGSLSLLAYGWRSWKK